MTKDQAFEILDSAEKARIARDKCDEMINKLEAEADGLSLGDRANLDKRIKAWRLQRDLAHSSWSERWAAWKAAARETGMLHPRAPGVW